MKYKVGDKVRIKKDLEICEGWIFSEDMSKYKGKKATITSVFDETLGYYKLDLDEGYYVWTDVMLEPYKELYKEHWAEKIIEIAKSGSVAVDKETRKPVNCKGFSCGRCLFDGDSVNHCRTLRTELFDSEYEEPKPKIQLTQFEHEYLKECKQREFKYITRDKCGKMWLYEDFPTKGNACWDNRCRYFSCEFDDLFKFVKWEDEKPCSIEEILNKCEIEERRN